MEPSAAYRAARDAWPGIVVDEADFRQSLERAGAPIASLCLADLYLARACCAGDARALATFDEKFLAQVPAILARHRARDAADEVRQLVRERLFVAPPKIASYTGRGSLAGWLRITVLLAVPAAVALAVLAVPLIAMLFQYGQFSAQDAWMTRQALVAYSVGLVGMILVKILAPGFYARQNVATPVKIGVFTLVATQLMNLAFVGPLRHAGLALAGPVSGQARSLILALAPRSAAPPANAAPVSQPPPPLRSNVHRTAAFQHPDKEDPPSARHGSPSGPDPHSI